MSGSNFVDYVKICCRSGKGGAGSTHLHRDKKNPYGGPDGRELLVFLGKEVEQRTEIADPRRVAGIAHSSRHRRRHDLLGLHDFQGARNRSPAWRVLFFRRPS